MQYADIALPVRIARQETIFSYSIPPALLPDIAIGKIVRVPFRKSKIDGVLLGLSKSVPAQIRFRLKPIDRVLSPWPLFSAEDLLIRKNLASATLSPVGLTTSSILPPARLYKESFTPDAQEKISTNQQVMLFGPLLDRLEQLSELIIKTIKYGTVVIVVPTKPDVATWHTWLEKIGIHQPVIFDRSAGVADQLPAWRAALSRTPTIILGTRSTCLLPLRNIALTILVSPMRAEHREEQIPQYSTLDVARLQRTVKGGSLVLFDSLPPLEILLTPARRTWQFSASTKQPQNIRILKKEPRVRLLPTIIDHLELVAANRKPTLFVATNSGWARGLVCSDCGDFLSCTTCDRLAYVNQAGTVLACNHCDTKTQAPSVCPHCQSANLHAFGWGSERWHEELEKLFPKNSVIVTHLSDIEQVLTTFSSVICLEPERMLFAADFLGYERWMRLMLSVRDHTRDELLIQTSIPDHPLFQELGSALPKQALVEELKTRRAYAYPPYGHIARFTFGPANTVEAQKITALILKHPVLTTLTSKDILGPSEMSAGDLSFWQVQAKIPIQTNARVLGSLQTGFPKGVRMEFNPIAPFFPS